MNLLNFKYEDVLIKQIFSNILEEFKSNNKPRNYIGASSIGDDCELKLWLKFKYPHLAKLPSAQLVMATNDGHRGEAYVASLLKQIPDIKLITHDYNGNQLGFSDFNGKFKGHCDGIIEGLPMAPKTSHIWEHKEKNSKSFDALTKIKENYDIKKVLREWDYVYYCQAVIYMDYFDCTRHYMTVGLSGTRDLQSIRTDANPLLAKILKDKAQRIINAIVPPIGISNNKSFWKCKMCGFSEYCPSINPEKKNLFS